MSDYKNRLHVTAEIVDPIIKTVSVYPVKDAYLTQQEPVSPHGIQRFLFVNQSRPEDQMGDKIIMAFDVPKLTDPQYENITSVELILQAPKIPGHDRTFDIKYHEDNNWVEDGTTWLGQPIDGNEVIKSKTLSATQKTLIYDITDIFKSHNNENFHFPITILERDTGITNSPYQFLSRESGTTTSPVININYAYFAANMDANKIDGKVTVRRNVPNETEPAPDLPGSVDIWGGMYKNDLPGVIRPKTHYADLNFDIELPYENDTEDSIHEHAIDLAGIINVRKNLYSFLPGVVNVMKTVDNELDGRVDINIYMTRPGSPNIDDPPARLPSDGRWVQPLPTPYLPGVIGITTGDGDTGLDGYVNVCGHAELPGTVIVKRNVPNDQELAPDLPGTLGIHKYHADDGGPDDEINKHVPSHNLPGTVIIGFIPDESELEGTVIIRRNVPNNTEPAPDLPGRVTINEYFGQGELDGTLNITAQDAIDGTVTIDWHNDNSDLPGVINIIGHRNDDLEGRVVIPAHTDLEGIVRTRYRKTQDMEGKIYIDDASSGAYAFIIE